jgi:hypothetical protein
LRPRWESLPIGATIEESQADAALVIGDRAIASHSGTYALEWDLGQQWTEWTGLPFVFAMWIARPDVDLHGVAAGLEAARSDGLARLESIAAEAAPSVGISSADCLSYLRDNNLTRIEAKPAAGESWTQHMADLAAGTLLPQADSWYMGANIPGKPRQLLHYLGVQEYLAFCRESAANGYSGFGLR